LFAAKPAKTAKPARPGKAARADATTAPDFAKYDANQNGTIDAENTTRSARISPASPKARSPSSTTNGDAKLSDDELAAFKPAAVKGKADKSPRVPRRTKAAAAPAKPDEVKPEDPGKKPKTQSDCGGGA